MNYSGKSFVICGLGISGRAVAEALSRCGARLWLWDDGVSQVQLGELARHYGAQLDTTLAQASHPAWREISALVVSPGIPLTFPAPHPLVVAARAAGVSVIGDVELFCRALTSAANAGSAVGGVAGGEGEVAPARAAALPGSIVGITGTNGKSTVTALIAHLLTRAHVPVQMGGNIGTPVLRLGAPPDEVDAYVLELSSWQLETCPSLRADVAVFTNISPDHLDRHGGMEEYVAAKERLWQQQTSGQKIVICVDDHWSRGMLERMCAADRGQDVVAICRSDDVQARYGGDGGVAVVRLRGRTAYFPSAQSITLPRAASLVGEHNVANAVSALCAAQHLGVSLSDLLPHLETFEGLPHRNELVAISEGVAYVNDSKATNPEAAALAIGAWDKVHWIAGGIAKRGDIDPVMEVLHRISRVYLIGEAAQEFAILLAGRVPVELCTTLDRAVQRARHHARQEARALATGGLSDTANRHANDAHATVLLSPACASFDQFLNYTARGKAFVEIVRRMV